MNFINIRKICQPLRIALGLTLIAMGFVFSNPWFFLGAVPLAAGVMNFCPLCIITKKCDI